MAVYEVFVDGAARGQGKEPGVNGNASCGAVIYRNQKRVGQIARLLGRRTNNEAEYEAVLMALMICWSRELADPIIYCDSLVVVNQVNNVWQCTDEKLLPLYLSVKEIEKEYRFRLVHEPRRFVHEADLLANQMLDLLEEQRIANDAE